MIVLLQYCAAPPGSLWREINTLTASRNAVWARKNRVIFTNDLRDRAEGRPQSWGKIKAILHAFRNPKVEAVISIDTDAFFQHDPSLRELLSKNDVMFAQDFNGINCGLMTWRNNTWSKRTLAETWGLAEYMNHVWWEQAAIHSLQARGALDGHYACYPETLIGRNANTAIYHAVGVPRVRKLDDIKQAITQ
jgi:hypothetical protein